MTDVPPGRGGGPGWLMAVMAGVTLGAANSLSSALGSPYHPLSLAPGQGVQALQYLAAWLGTGWAWAVFAYAIGWASHRLSVGILRALAGLWAAVLVYYVSDVALRTNGELSVGEIAIWSVISVLTAPVMAALGWWSRRPSRWRLLAALAGPGLMVVDTLWAPSGPDSIRPYAQWWVYAGAAVWVLALLVLTWRRRRAISN